MEKPKVEISPEEAKNGVISEEALDEIAGGFKVNKNLLKKVLTGASVAVLVGGGLGALGGYAQQKYEEKHGPGFSPEIDF